MAWQMGHPLSQTLFTSIYLDKLLWPAPKSFDEYSFCRGDAEARLNAQRQSPLVHLVLRAYCLALVKSCDLVHRRITQEYYYEVGIDVFISRGKSGSDASQEEDFVPQLYNRSLLGESDVEPVQQVLESAVDYLQKLGSDDDDDDNRRGEINLEVKNALIDRLHLRKFFLKALTTDVEAILSGDSESFKACFALIPSLDKSAVLGKPVQESFTLKIQRKLASTIPPRPMVTIDLQAAVDYMKRLFQDAIDLHEILIYSNPDDLRVCCCHLMSPYC